MGKDAEKSSHAWNFCLNLKLMFAKLGISRVALACALLTAAAASAAPVKIVSWNIEWFPGRDPNPTPEMEREHMAEVQDMLRRIQPDVLLIIEARNAEVVRRAVEVVPGLHLNAISEFAGRAQQIAIASRYPMRRGGQATWLRFFAGPPRGFTFAELELPDGKCLHVYGVHLKSNRGAQFVNQSLRELSSIQLTHFIRAIGQTDQCPAAGVVIAGDFNTSLDAPMHRHDESIRYLIGSGMHWAFEGLKPEDRLTWFGRKGDFEPIQFDHFLTGNLGKPRGEVLKTGRVSDHKAIQIVIDTDDIQPDAQPETVPSQ